MILIIVGAWISYGFIEPCPSGTHDDEDLSFRIIIGIGIQ
jgi:hypothetical protein